MLGEKFSNSWCLGYRKTHLLVKLLNIDIYNHATPRQKSPPGSYHHPQGRRKLLTPTKFFFENLFPPSSFVEHKKQVGAMTVSYLQC